MTIERALARDVRLVDDDVVMAIAMGSLFS